MTPNTANSDPSPRAGPPELERSNDGYTRLALRIAWSIGFVLVAIIIGGTFHKAGRSASESVLIGVLVGALVTGFGMLLAAIRQRFRNWSRQLRWNKRAGKH